MYTEYYIIGSKRYGDSKLFDASSPILKLEHRFKSYSSMTLANDHIKVLKTSLVLLLFF